MSKLSGLMKDLKNADKLADTVKSVVLAAQVINDKENNLTNLETKIEKKRKEYAKAEETFQAKDIDAAEKLAKAETTLANAKQTAKETIGKAQAEAKDLIDVEKGDLKKLRAQKKKLKSENEGLEQDIVTLSTEKDNLEKKIEKLRKTLQSSLKQIS